MKFVNDTMNKRGLPVTDDTNQQVEDLNSRIAGIRTQIDDDESKSNK